MSFITDQRSYVENLIKNSEIFNNDLGEGIFRNKFYPFILQDWNNNLIPQFNNSICEYFKMNKISWWNGIKPTNHTLSSQIACLNHLFPLREDREATLLLAKSIIPELEDVLLITTDKYSPAYIQFEAVSNTDHLNEDIPKRGNNCTSIDALIYGLHKDGRKMLLIIEWKYTESYSNTNLASDKRKERYDDLIKQSNQLKTSCHDIYYFEPFYQLMRQTLWAEQMVVNKNNETIKADDYVHLHVIPTENCKLINKVYKCSNSDMEGTWCACLNNNKKYVVISPKVWVAPIVREKYPMIYEYLRKRYW